MSVLEELHAKRAEIDAAITAELNRTRAHTRAAVTGSPDRYAMTRDEWSRLIIATVAYYYDVAVDQMCSRAQDHVTCQARHVAFWLLVKCERSYPEVGKHFGCHHTTVMHGYRRVEREPDMLRIARRIYKGLTDSEDVA